MFFIYATPPHLAVSYIHANRLFFTGQATQLWLRLLSALEQGSAEVRRASKVNVLHCYTVID